MNAHSRVLRRALQLCLFVGMLLGLAVLRPAPVARAVNTTSDCFALSNEGVQLISKLISAGYGDFNLDDIVVSIDANTDPSVSGIITIAFMNALAASPVSSAIFTTKLKDVLASGNTVEICTDGTVQYKTFFGSAFAQTFPTLVSTIGGVGSANFTHDPPTTPLSSWTIGSTTYNLFGIGWAGQSCFALSNEGGGLISKLDVAGYGNYNLYQALVAIQQETDPSVAGIITDQFLTTLSSAPPSSGIFTTKLKNVDTPGNTVEICTDGTVQYKTFSGSTFAQTFPTLVSTISGVGSANFTHDPPTGPLSSWTVGSTAYGLSGIGWMVGQWTLYLPLVIR